MLYGRPESHLDDFRKEELKKEGVGNVELILPLIAKHL